MPLLSDLKLILTSPLTRAFQTAEIVAEKLSLTNNLIKDQRLSPGFDTTQLVAVLDDYPDQDLMMLVGHEPDFSLTISSIIGGGNLVCKKGGLARVNLYSRSPLTGELVWLVPPKIIIG
jgi:phosphohistidine phosphatase